MVSGLVTSPCDHERIFSGDARLIRMASKSDVSDERLSKDGLIVSFGENLTTSIPNSKLQTPNSKDLLKCEVCSLDVWSYHLFSQYRFTFARLRHRFEHGPPLRLHQLDVQAQRLKLADEDVERFRQARLERCVTLDDRLVNLRAARHVVGLRGEEFLEDVRRAGGLQRPPFHFS